MLFGKLRNDCVYILIDTSHSMKGKLDLVKDKIIQFIQVRWGCQVHAFGGLCIMNAPPPVITYSCYERCTSKMCTQDSVGKPLQERAPYCRLENYQFFFANRPFLWWILSVMHGLLREFLCPLLQVFSILKSVMCTYFHHFPYNLQLSIFILITNVLQGYCVHWPQN